MRVLATSAYRTPKSVGKKGKGSPFSITERRVPELIPVLGSQPEVMWIINPAVSCHYFPPGLQLPPQPLRGPLPILPLDEQRHNGCEQFAYFYPTASQLRFEPRPFCAWVQHANHSATEPPFKSVSIKGYFGHLRSSEQHADGWVWLARYDFLWMFCSDLR